MSVQEYIDIVNTRFKSGISREHSYRGDLQTLLSSIVTDVLVTNEPARISCGAPDYIITKGKNNIPVGYIEAKDIGKPLNSKDYKEQFDRYKASLPNLIITDYLEFQLYIEGSLKTSISIAEIQGNKIVAKPENFEAFSLLIKNFCTQIGQTIKSAPKLAKMMASNAKLMATIIENALNSDEENQANSTLKDQMLAFKDILIHDINNKAFADIYAQTIAYGMFAARYHDPTLPTFSREEAATLIPKSNPFLRKLFQYIAGYDLDTRIAWIIDALVEIFLATDVADILQHFGKSTQQNDPVIHFYETFLAEYDPALRKSRGVWYTPEPVVNFIVRAVDDILKTEFGLKDGIADTSKTRIKTFVQGNNKAIEQEVHKVQILDPAAGTGTFLAEVVKQIYKKFEGQQGIWSNYVEEHLIPRLNGFEILMASYAMAHLKLDMLFNETGYKPTKEQRFRVYLTNSLEEHHPDTGTLFASWLSTEANEANHVKRDTPVMVILGNPPYSGESSNKGEWIMNLMDDYKKEPGGKEKLNERNPKWINDDYVKFIRYGQHFIEKNGNGVIAFINPHGYLDNPTFRGMRWNLLKTYDKIYTIDLHGNSKKKEVCLDGSPDENVFDIQQGVSINLFVKTGNKKNEELGKVFHYDLYGKRELKYNFLLDNSLKTIAYKELPNIFPNYFYVNKDFEEQEIYDLGLKVNELFIQNNVGIVTARDEFSIHETKEDVKNAIEEFLHLDDETARTRFNLGNDVRDWQVNFARKDLQNNFPDKGIFTKVSYRLFDDRWTFYTGKSKGFHCYPRTEVMQHFVKAKNVGLALCKQFKSGDTYQHVFITNKIIESSLVSNKTSEITSIFPLYLYPDTNGQQTINQNNDRIPNLNLEIVNQITVKIGLTFTSEKDTSTSPVSTSTFAPLDILDYIYAVLHSPNYREKYKEFLKIDFPRVPYPSNTETFWKLVKLGGELRQIHLLESPIVEKYITQYPEDGNNVVSKIRFENFPPLEGCPKGGVEILTHINGTPIQRNFVENLPHNPELNQLAKDKRKAGILSEVLFWQQVHQRKFYNIDFDRQRIIGSFIVDFYVKTLGLIVEIDGSSHKNKVEYDAERQQYMENLGLRFYRISDSDVKKNIDIVMQDLENYIVQEYGIEPPRLSATPPKEGNLGRVYINDTQYFNNVPQIAWNFYIGGYQPAQKWLKDRKGRELSFEDILHYQKIIVALTETDRLMKDIDEVGVE